MIFPPTATLRIQALCERLMVCTNAPFSLRRGCTSVIACLGIALLLASCGGGGANVNGTAPAGSANSAVLPNLAGPKPGGSQPMPAATVTPAAVPVQLHYVLPRQVATSSATSRLPASANTARNLQYISPANTKINITVTPLGGAGMIYGPTACINGACAINFTATPGPNTIVFTLTDGTNTLSTFSTTTIVQPAVLNTLNFTANPVVNSVSLNLTSPSVNAGVATNDLLTVNAMDKDSNIIVGNSNYVDVNGKPVALSLNVTNAQAGGKGTITIQGPLRITAPGHGAIYAHYDGKWLASSTISVTSNSSAVTSLANTTMSITPTAYNYPAGVSNPGGIVFGPDGNIWYPSFNSAKIGRMTLAGVVSTFTVAGGGAGINFICVGPDGNLWFTPNGFGATWIGTITTSGTIKQYPTGLAPVGGITTGPDGNLWFVAYTPDSINSITTSGVVTSFTTGLTDGWGPDVITLGPDGNLWTHDNNQNAIVRTTPAGISTQFTYPGGATQSEFAQIVTGSDGNLWFPTADTSAVGMSSPGGSIARYTVGLNAGADLDGIAAGPDGNIWFADNGTTSAIGVINVVTKQITNYTNGVPVNGAPGEMVLGPDGNLWTIEQSTNQITKFVY